MATSQVTNTRMDVLKEAYGIFVKMIEKYASEQNLSANDKDKLIGLAKKAYQEKMAEYYFVGRLSKLNNILNSSVEYAFKHSAEKDITPDYSVGYIKCIKHLKELMPNG
ncbi:MAG: hypothetical protein LBL58_11580 [Tannerellaceae bacterium]|jgi:hypothetical protein|nr:hypothetical protein [Tannerellaceae bacterium]